MSCRRTCVGLKKIRIKPGPCTELIEFKIGGPDKKLQNNVKNWGIYNLNSVIISRVLRILVSQNRFHSLHV